MSGEQQEKSGRVVLRLEAPFSKEDVVTVGYVSVNHLAATLTSHAHRMASRPRQSTSSTSFCSLFRLRSSIPPCNAASWFSDLNGQKISTSSASAARASSKDDPTR